MLSWPRFPVVKAVTLSQRRAPGEEFADAQAAMAKAREIARELLADSNGEWGSTTIDVHDENRALIGIVIVREQRLQ